jgi:hypothetical protein
VVKILIFISMLFIFSIPVTMTYLCQLKTVVFQHWCLMCIVLLGTFHLCHTNQGGQGKYSSDCRWHFCLKTSPVEVGLQIGAPYPIISWRNISSFVRREQFKGTEMSLFKLFSNLLKNIKIHSKNKKMPENSSSRRRALLLLLFGLFGGHGLTWNGGSIVLEK